MAIHSLNPRSMAAHQALYESAMAGTATTDADVDALREAGFSDRDILDITGVCG